MDYRDEAVKALEAQGFSAPGPALISLVADAFAREDEDLPAGVRRLGLSYTDLIADTPELRDRVPEQRDLGTEVSFAVADVLNAAKDHRQHHAES